MSVNLKGSSKYSKTEKGMLLLNLKKNNLKIKKINFKNLKKNYYFINFRPKILFLSLNSNKSIEFILFTGTRNNSQ